MSRLKGFISQLFAPASSLEASSDESLLARYREGDGAASNEAADKNVVEEEERADSDRRIQAVIQELRAMPPKDRLLMKLFDVDGLTMNEVARILGEAATALFRRRDRIRAAIRKRLKERGFDIDEDPE